MKKELEAEPRGRQRVRGQASGGRNPDRRVLYRLRPGACVDMLIHVTILSCKYQNAAHSQLQSNSRVKRVKQRINQKVRALQAAR